MFISQANNRLAFNSQGVMLQSLVLRRDDLTAAIFWIFNTKLQAVAEKIEHDFRIEFHFRQTRNEGQCQPALLRCFFCGRSGTVCLQLRQMFFRPAAQAMQRLYQSAAQARQRVLHLRRNNWMDSALHETIAFEAAQRLR